MRTDAASSVAVAGAIAPDASSCTGIITVACNLPETVLVVAQRERLTTECEDLGRHNLTYECGIGFQISAGTEAKCEDVAPRRIEG